jgi:type VI secretion system protein ImpH
MDTAPGREGDAVAVLEAIRATPHAHDFYQALRRLECLYADKPRWGEALRPADEPVRFGQEPDVTFAPAPLAACEPGRDGRPPRLQVRLFGLLGPNGPMPLHVTEYARERLRNGSDPTLSRFLDLFHHRFLALFYRAWAQSQPHVHRDRPGADKFAGYIGAFFGIARPSCRGRDTVPDDSKLFHVGALIRQVRNAAGLAGTLQHFFRVPAAVEEFVGHWLGLGPGERTFLGGQNATLGTDTVVGRRVWDRQSRFRVRLGPLTFVQYSSFLPATEAALRQAEAAGTTPTRAVPLAQLVDWVRLYDGFEHDWDARLVLKHDEVPPLRLGGGGQLGWTTWLGRRRSRADASDLCLRAERFVPRPGGAS